MCEFIDVTDSVVTSGEKIKDKSKEKIQDKSKEKSKDKNLKNKSNKKKGKEKSNDKSKDKTKPKSNKKKGKDSKYKVNKKSDQITRKTDEITVNTKGEPISATDMKAIKSNRVPWYTQNKKHGCVIGNLGYVRQSGGPRDVDPNDQISKNSYHQPTQTILIRQELTGNKRKGRNSEYEPPTKKTKVVDDDDRSDDETQELEVKNENQKEEIIKSQHSQERDEEHCLKALESNSICNRASTTIKLRHMHHTIEGLVLSKPIQLTHRHHIRLKSHALQQRCITESKSSGAYFARSDLVYDFNGKTNVNGSFGLLHKGKHNMFPDQQLWSKKMDGDKSKKRFHGSCHEHVLNIYREYLSSGDESYTRYADHLIQRGLGTMEYYFANVCTQVPKLTDVDAAGYNHIIAKFNAALLQCVDYLLCSLLCIEKNAFHNFDESKRKLNEPDYHYTINCHLRDNIAVANGGYEIKGTIGQTPTPQEELTLVKRVGLCKFCFFLFFGGRFVSFCFFGARIEC